jgi:hypothetical protein
MKKEIEVLKARLKELETENIAAIKVLIERIKELGNR